MFVGLGLKNVHILARMILSISRSVCFGFFFILLPLLFNYAGHDYLSIVSYNSDPSHFPFCNVLSLFRFSFLLYNIRYQCIIPTLLFFVYFFSFCYKKCNFEYLLCQFTKTSFTHSEHSPLPSFLRGIFKVRGGCHSGLLERSKIRHRRAQSFKPFVMGNKIMRTN